MNNHTQRYPTQQQFLGNLLSYLQGMNNYVSETSFEKINYRRVKMLNKLNKLCLSLFYGEITFPQNLLVIMDRINGLCKIVEFEKILSKEDLSSEVYQSTLRRFFKLTEKYMTMPYLMIPSLNEAYIKPAIYALIEFLLEDIAKRDERKAKFFIERLLKYTIVFEEEDCMNSFLEEKKLTHFYEIEAPSCPEDYLLIRNETEGRLEFTCLALPYSEDSLEQRKINSLFFKQLFEELDNRMLLDHDMIHRLACLANFESESTEESDEMPPSKKIRL